jgi:hypothetical protein
MGRRIPDIDWKAVAVFVITNDQLSVADISRELEIPYEAIRSRAKRGKWLKLREERLRKLEGEVALIPPDPITGSRRLKLDHQAGAESPVESQTSQQTADNHEVRGGKQAGSSSRNHGAGRAIPVGKAAMDGMEIIAGRTKFAEKGGEKRSIEEATADIWAKRKNEHRDMMYKFGHTSLKGITTGRNKLKAPRTWKDAQIADSITRKAAGLDENTGPQINVMIALGALNGALKSI